jgi:hypothetical protein
MEEFRLASWEDFEREIGEVLRRYSERCQGLRGLRHSPSLFRGQEKASWPLKTTLERYTERPYTMKEYWKMTRNFVKSPVESLTEKRWDIGKYPEEGPEPHGPPLGYEFMVYLRHHGFPSPLLDWSQSPYVAAFFAFRSPAGTKKSQEDPDGEVAIYCFQEYWEGAKVWDENEPHIIGLGPNIVTTPRHFRQQSWYTICRVLRNGWHGYASHEEVLRKGDTHQDVLKKYRIPASQRDRFLEGLSLMNISAYTLFGTEDSLMETLAYKAIAARV